ncbi:PGRS family protein [Sorangium atrum]|uniref:PGRS family protein n=1 Tax=Sorangium atrum TaxID=2995308 RepID=A0ABT5CFE3_9BACT|nr:PGRS family protein [Sorangium aterium]MDC0684353.1 PGRS family protein [Sorangium aterium]
MSSGCASFWSDIAGDCEEMLTCEHFRPTASSGSGPHAGCVPSESADAVSDACGVFVAASGNDGSAGTKAEPVKTLTEAIARAADQRTAVYACAEAFAEVVEVPASATLFGGLDCANGWRWIGEEKKTIVAPGVEAIPLKLVRGEGAMRIEDFSVRASDAQAAGSSSIAVLAAGATVELTRCELIAGNGANGADGEDAPSEAAMQGPRGEDGASACSDLDASGAPDETLAGGAQVESVCGDGALSIGGAGGVGNVSNGSDGATSQGTAETARGGLGESVTGAWDCAGAEPNGGGDAGVSGGAGDAGVGASGNGTLSASGYAGVSGGAGGAGKPGQGGGGGGGAKGGAICPGAATGAGASGGSGGAGGCGGLPGRGGGAGGASIPLVSVEGKVTLTDCSLKAGSGGKGGAGGDLQPGGSGGVGGLGGMGVGGSNPACDGGRGGKGGNGGPGGGGLGGPSLAIAFRGEPVKQEGKTVLMAGTPGAGGPGGSNNVASNGGADGVTAAERELP